MAKYLIPSGRLLTTGDFLDVAVVKLMSPGIVAISAGASLHNAYDTLINHQIHAVLVIDEKTGAPLGWATAAGLIDHAEADPALLSASDAITAPPHGIRVDATVREAIARLAELEASHLIVTREGSDFPVGVISALDVAAFLGRSD